MRRGWVVAGRCRGWPVARRIFQWMVQNTSTAINSMNETITVLHGISFMRPPMLREKGDDRSVHEHDESKNEDNDGENVKQHFAAKTYRCPNMSHKHLPWL